MYRDICHLNRRAQLFGPLCLALGLEAAIVAGIGPPPAHADAGAESDSSRPAERSASPSAKGTRSSLGRPSRISSSRNRPSAHNAAAIPDSESSPSPSLPRVLFPDAAPKPPAALLALPGSPRHDGPPDPAASASVIPPDFAARLHVPEVLAKPARACLLNGGSRRCMRPLKRLQRRTKPSLPRQSAQPHRLKRVRPSQSHPHPPPAPALERPSAVC